VNASWGDLTVKEIADHLIDRILAEGGTGTAAESQSSTAAPAAAVKQLTEGLERARQLRGRCSAARRAELDPGLKELADAVAAALRLLADQSRPANERHD
jgi:hypothetical protein